MSRVFRLGFGMQGGAGWAGGAEYIRNLIQATQAAADADGLTIETSLFSSRPIEGEWRERLGGLAQIVILPPPVRVLHRVLHLGNWHFARALRKRKIEFLYPLTYQNTSNLGLRFPLDSTLSSCRWAGWIPDFQHRHLPQLFSPEDLLSRDEGITRLAAEAETIVFSSETAARDYAGFYPGARAKAFLLRFCTAADTTWFEGDPLVTQQRYRMPDRFFLVSNQFWQHKNHATIFAALGLLAERGVRPHIVCTGALTDYRSLDHIDALRSQISELGIGPQVSLLGMVPRFDQIQLMRRALAVIQPSLCEGWSTVVEDARILGKAVLLSDLPVHREQNPPGAQFFPCRDPDALAREMAAWWEARTPGPDAEYESAARNAAPAAILAFGRQFLHLATGQPS